jgi:26S proteasome regulatory subunit (ATPase 3-interacting protein)
LSNFTVGDVSSNLHNAVTKTTAQKILTQLAEQGQIVCKTYGKQQIYFIAQVGGSIKRATLVINSLLT